MVEEFRNTVRRRKFTKLQALGLTVGIVFLAGIINTLVALPLLGAFGGTVVDVVGLIFIVEVWRK